MVSSSDLFSRISDHYPELIRIPDGLNDTARSWSIPGHNGTFGFISSMSDHFCSTCNRLRITADGKIKVRFLIAYAVIPKTLFSYRFVSSMPRKFRSETRCEAEQQMLSFSASLGMRSWESKRNMSGWKTLMS